MSNDLNLCQFIGRLGNDPEQKTLPNGNAVTNMSIAVGEQWKDKNTGQKQEATEWVRVVAFGKLAEIMGQYLNKGSKVYVSGKMKTRKWQDQSGNDRYSTEIIAKDMQMLDSRSDSAPQQHAPQQAQQPAPQQAPPQQPAPSQEVQRREDDFDGIPFANPYKDMEYLV